MKTPSVSLLLGVSVLLLLLLSGLAVCAVFSFSPPAPPSTPFLHLVVVIPYCISTFLMVSIHKSTTAGHQPVFSMVMVQDSEGDQGLEEDYDDINNVTTEHEF